MMLHKGATSLWEGRAAGSRSQPCLHPPPALLPASRRTHICLAAHDGRDAITVRASPLAQVSEAKPWDEEEATVPERLQHRLLDALGYKGTNKVVALEGNFGPVNKEIFVEGLDVVEGALPIELNGVYIRNGPNPMFEPYNKHHWFEGDGMVHAVRINNGSANYCNAYVKTNRLEQQKRFGRPTWAKLADHEGMAGIGIAVLEQAKMQMGIVDVSAGVGNANTSVAYHAGRLLALHEGDMPYQLYISPEGRVRTVKRLNLGWRWNAPTDNFTAHPKLDARTGDLHFLSYHFLTPQIKLGTLNSRGNLSYDFLVDMPQNSLVHDMAITQSSKIIFNFPFRFDLMAMVTKNSLPMDFKEEQASHIGLSPHTATSQDQIQWFSLPSFMAFHVVNAREEGPNGRFVTIYLIAMKRMDMSASNWSDDYNVHMHKVTLDRMKGTAAMHKVTSIIGDFPVVHPLMQGQHTKHAWTSIFRPGDVMGVSVGIAKYDLTSCAMAAKQDACVAQIRYPPGFFGGEANFVPRNANNPSAACDGDDDGFLMSYVHHAEANTTYLMVFDAKTMSDKPIAKVKLPQRVPYGFHGLFLNQEQLMKMKAA